MAGNTRSSRFRGADTDEFAQNKFADEQEAAAAGEPGPDPGGYRDTVSSKLCSAAQPGMRVKMPILIRVLRKGQT
uniref:Uncharacterized protein n=1 Tax=Prolemur simus TaxID=1328070 RepID=A0A8C8Z2Q3_PROSS